MKKVSWSKTTLLKAGFLEQRALYRVGRGVEVSHANLGEELKAGN